MSQRDALPATALAEHDEACFFASPGFPELDCLTASFRRHTYAFHSHETYTIGAINAGCETWVARGARHYAGPGWLALTNPLDVHDGKPHGAGYAYRMSYPPAALLRTMAGEISGRTFVGTPMFKQPAVHDPAGARLFSEAHRLLQIGADTLAGDECLRRAYAHVLVRHACTEPMALGRERGPVARAREAIEQCFSQQLQLADLAAIAGLSVHHFIRVFRAEVGLTPHAHVVDVRIRRAQALLKGGSSPAATAALVGFADQAHLTRAFKARLGVTPGAYRRAHLG